MKFIDAAVNGFCRKISVYKTHEGCIHLKVVFRFFNAFCINNSQTANN